MARGLQQRSQPVRTASENTRVNEKHDETRRSVLNVSEKPCEEEQISSKTEACKVMEDAVTTD